MSLLKQKAEEYGVSLQLMTSIIRCESQFNPDIQSHHTYKTSKPAQGIVAGEREKSFGLVQIHLPAHPTIRKEQALDPEFSVDFLAKNLKAGRASMWSCYRQVAMQ